MKPFCQGISCVPSFHSDHRTGPVPLIVKVSHTLALLDFGGKPISIGNGGLVTMFNTHSFAFIFSRWWKSCTK